MYILYVHTIIAAYLFNNNLLGYMSEGTDTNIRLPRSYVSELLKLPTRFLSPHVLQEYPHGNPLRLALSNFQISITYTHLQKIDMTYIHKHKTDYIRLLRGSLYNSSPYGTALLLGFFEA
jgi:hypothetical protein